MPSHLSTLVKAVLLCKAGSRFCCLVALLAQDRSTNLWLERHLIVFAAIVANHLESRRSVVSGNDFL